MDTQGTIGLISEVFTEEHLQSLKGETALGHVRDNTPPLLEGSEVEVVG